MVTPAPLVYRNDHIVQGNEVGRGEIMLLTANGLRRLTHDSVFDGNPAISPDGRRVVFVSGLSSPYQLYVVRSDGSGLRRLTSMTQGAGEPAWSPDGTRIVFRSPGPHGNFQLYVVPSVGGAATLVKATPGNDRSPSWSPDGATLAFECDLFVCTLNLHTSRVHRLVAGLQPDWSPDGRSLAFTRNGRIYEMRADGTHVRALPSGTPLSAERPRFSPDGRDILFERGGQVVLLDLASGRRSYVTSASTGTNLDPDW